MGEKDNINLGWDVFKSMASPDAENLPEENLDGEINMDFNFSQRVRVFLDKKRRGGKAVTIVEGIKARDQVMKDLTKSLKTKFGGGGAYKDGQIIIQGNHRDKVIQILIDKGFKDVKPSGG